MSCLLTSPSFSSFFWLMTLFCPSPSPDGIHGAGQSGAEWGRVGERRSLQPEALRPSRPLAVQVLTGPLVSPVLSAGQRAAGTCAPACIGPLHGSGSSVCVISSNSLHLLFLKPQHGRQTHATTLFDLQHKIFNYTNMLLYSRYVTDSCLIWKCILKPQCFRGKCF